MTRLLFVLICSACAWAADSLSTISDTFRDPQLRILSGTITATLDSSCVTAAGTRVTPKAITATITPGGSFSIKLLPTDQCTDDGHYYSVVAVVGGVTLPTMTWTVPTSGPTLKIANVVQGATPVPTAAGYGDWAWGAAPAAPAAGKIRLYSQENKGICWKVPAGTEICAGDTASTLASHTANVANPHTVTKTQVGLGNVPNTDATNASNIASGTLDAARLPATITGDKSFTGSVSISGTVTVKAGADLQSVIGGLSAGGTINIPPGNYTGPLTLGSNITLACASRQAVISLPNGANTSVVTIPQGAGNVLIQHCGIAGNSAGQTGTSHGVYAAGQNTNIVLDDVAIDSTHDAGVRQTYTGDAPTSYNQTIKVMRCSITHTGTHGLQISDASDLWITDNYFYDWGARVATNDAIGVDGYNVNFHVNRNTGVNHSSTYFFMESAAPGYMLVAQNGDVSNNTISTDSGAAGAATGFSGYFFKTTFSSNVHIVSDPTITNACSHRAGYEINGSNNTISGNQIINGSIAYTAYEQPVSGWRIEGNTITQACASQGDNGAIMVASQDGTALISDGAITSNIIKFTAGTRTGIILGVYGVRGPVARIKVSGNQITGSGSGSSGIGMYSLSSPVTSDITVTDNRFANCGNYGLAVSQGDNYGDSYKIMHNDFRGCNGYGTAVVLPVGVTNVSNFDNQTDSNPVVQNLNGGATVDSTGKATFPGGVVSGGGGTGAPNFKTGTGSITWSTIGANSCASQSVSVTDANTTNNGVSCSPLGDLAVYMTWSAYVYSAGTVRIIGCNPYTTPISPDTKTWGCTVSQ